MTTTFVIDSGDVNGGDVDVSNADLGVGGPDDQIHAEIVIASSVTDIDNIFIPNLGVGDPHDPDDDIDVITFDLSNFSDDFSIIVGNHAGGTTSGSGSGSSTGSSTTSANEAVAQHDVFFFPSATSITGDGLHWTVEYTGADGDTYTVTIEAGLDEDGHPLPGSIKVLICFTRGTMIKTADGEVPVETLSIGDRVLTLDGGYQEIRWIGSNKVTAEGLEANPKLLPIRIRSGALGKNVPQRDLVVSPQHRVLVRSVIAERMFGTSEVLVPAKKLLNVDGVDVEEEVNSVEYWHFLFDAHHVVWSNGAATESLFTGPEALKAVSAEALEEITTLFPDIARAGYEASSARPIPEKGKHMKRLAERHQKNRKPIFETDVRR